MSLYRTVRPKLAEVSLLTFDFSNYKKFSNDKSETKMTASVPKQDTNTQEVKQK